TIDRTSPRRATKRRETSGVKTTSPRQFAPTVMTTPYSPIRCHNSDTPALRTRPAVSKTPPPSTRRRGPTRSTSAPTAGELTLAAAPMTATAAPESRLEAPAGQRSEAPAGQMTWAVHISIAPTFFDPAEVPGVISPFMVIYALHDALVKPMPGKAMAPSLAES